MRTWTEEQEAWLAEHYAAEHRAALLAAFEERFGRKVTSHSMEMKAWKMGLSKKPREIPAKAVRMVRWSEEPEMQAWMDGHDKGQSLEVLSKAFAARFGFPLSRGQISLWRASNGRQTKRSHGGGRPLRPVGSERDTGKGYVLVKVAERAKVAMSKDNWRPKHIVVWERENGPLPEGMDVMFADRDHSDYDPGNLVAVPHRLMARLNSPGCPEWHDAASLKAAVAWCELHSAIATAEAGVPRRCGVCGREFVPGEGARLSGAARNSKTCPACRAAGKKARGERTVKFVGTCAVCGRQFEARQANQKRCRECIDRRPKWAADKQRGLKKCY